MCSLVFIDSRGGGGREVDTVFLGARTCRNLPEPAGTCRNTPVRLRSVSPGPVPRCPACMMLPRYAVCDVAVDLHPVKPHLDRGGGTPTLLSLTCIGGVVHPPC